MKPKALAILSGCGCGFLTLIGGTVIMALGCYCLYEYAEVRYIAGFRNKAPTVVPIAAGISGCLGILLDCRAGFLVYRWRQKKEAHRPPAATVKTP